ncbi:MAG: Fic family protein [Patescibacteria group bacterium]|jgi:cell filamentation protein
MRRQGETSYKDTSFGIIPRSKLIPLEIEGIKRAWDFVLASRKRGKIPITPGFILKTHKAGFGWIFPKTAGRYRSLDVRVSNYEPPKFYLLPQLMLNFTNDLNIRMKHIPLIDDESFFEELVGLLAWAHHQFLWIHPFNDYNGRIGRLLINMILLNLDLPPAELEVETRSGRKKYVEALGAADQGNNKKLEKLIYSALKEALRNLDQNRKT